MSSTTDVWLAVVTQTRTASSEVHVFPDIFLVLLNLHQTRQEWDLPNLHNEAEAFMDYI